MLLLVFCCNYCAKVSGLSDLTDDIILCIYDLPNQISINLEIDLNGQPFAEN